MSARRHAENHGSARTLVVMHHRVGALLWITSAIAYLAAEGIAAVAMNSGYDYVRDLVSDLGQPGASPRAALMNGAFVVQAVAFPLGAALTVRGMRRGALPFLALAASNGVGNLLVAVVHSGTGATAHAVGAVLAIVGGNAAILVHGATRGSGVGRIASVLTGVLGLVAFAVFALGASPAGAWERVGVYSIYAWQAVMGIGILSRRYSWV